MIYKNDKEYKLTKEEKHLYAKRMKFMLPPSLKVWNKLNNRYDMPRSIGLETFYYHFDNAEKENVMIRYVEKIQTDRKDKTEYFPDTLVIGHSGEINTTEQQADLNYFLSNHPGNGSNVSRDKSRIVQFVQEDKAAVAKVKATQSKELVEANHFIYSSGKEAKLRDIAKSLEIQNVDEMSFEEVQVHLEAVAKMDARYFMQRTEGTQLAARAKVQEALDYGIITYDDKESEWVYKTEEENEPKEKITGVNAGVDKTETLVRYLVTLDKKKHLELISDKIMAAKKKGVTA